jgi:hypothetical protein
MARNKIPKDKKRIKIGGTIDPDLYKILEEFLSDTGNFNKSKYLENLIKEDLIKHKRLL